MNRRILIPSILIVGLLSVVALVEYTGRLGSRSGTGAASGLGYSGGCAGTTELPAVKPDNIVVQDNLPIPGGGLRPEIDGVDEIPGQFIVKMTESATPDSILASAQARLLQPVFDAVTQFETPHLDFGLDRTFAIESSLDRNELFRQMSLLDSVEWIEPVRRVNAFGIPNDAYFGYQWNMTTLGLASAWDQSDGSGVVVAVVDTGVSGGGLDGFDNLLEGYDFVDGDTDASDENSHGTHVAGTIAQSTDNDEGTAGVAPGAAILPVRVLDADGSGSTLDVANGIVWAVDNGADIINLSLGGSAYSQALADACEYALDNGVLVVAASGNDGYTDFVSYPAALEAVIAVGATDLNGEISYFSNQGPEIDLVAPGGDMTEDRDGDGYVDGILQETKYEGSWSYFFFQGTSMATPHVAGIAALVQSAGMTGGDSLADLLRETAEDQGDEGWDTTFGHGMVSALNALANIPDETEEAPPEEEDPVEEDPVEEDPVEEDPTEEPEEEPDEEEFPRPDWTNPNGRRGPDIYRVSTNAINPYTASVSWQTNYLSTASATTSDGNSASTDYLALRHRVILRGEPGTTVTVLLESSAMTNHGMRVVEEEVELSFPDLN